MAETINHAERAHSLLSPSSAHRWMNCVPSARLSENFPNKTSTAAEEGTLAHEMGEHALSEYLLGNFEPMIDNLPIRERDANHKLFNAEMPDFVMKYVEFVTDSLAATGEGGELMLEKKYDVSEYVPEASGSCDATIIGKTVLHIIDLKYGRGVKVDADFNEQLMIYALGALTSLPKKRRDKIETVVMSIAQVRLGSYPSFTLSKAELMAWANGELKLRARMAFKGVGVCNAGNWCKFCPARPTCRAQADEIVKDFESTGDRSTLTDMEVAELIPRLDMYSDWISSLKEFVLYEALKGRQWPGFKVVAGRGTRVWVDEQSAADTLKLLDFKDADLYNTKFKGITDIERLVGKKEFPLLFENEVRISEGAPKLVPESDKRVAISSTLDDFSVEA